MLVASFGIDTRTIAQRLSLKTQARPVGTVGPTRTCIPTGSTVLVVGLLVNTQPTADFAGTWARDRTGSRHTNFTRLASVTTGSTVRQIKLRIHTRAAAVRQTLLAGNLTLAVLTNLS